MPLGGGVTLAASIIAAGSGIFSAAKSSRNQTLKREWEQTVKAMDIEQQKKVAQKMQEAKDVEAKRQVIVDTVNAATAERIKAIETNKAESQKSMNKLLILGAAGTVVVIVAIILVYNKKK